MENNGEIKVKSLQKALEILNCFAVKQPLGVTEISEKLGLYKSNVHNILVTFTAMEYLVQDPESGKFRLGPEVMMLSRAFRENLDITKIAVPVMRESANEVQELVYLAVPKGEDMLYLEAVSPENQRLVTKSVTGECSKMYCTSVGKAVLATMSEEDREKHIPEELEAFTEYTITDRRELDEEIRMVRERGYAVDDMEVMFGVKCVGVALLNHEGEAEGALSISAPSLRMNKENIQKYAEILKTSARKIQKLL